MDSATALVVKVHYAGVLRRFSIPVNVNRQLALDMSGLREKIVSLFNLPADAELTLTYTDEDGDVVTLADDNDLLDVVNQRLKFLKINVQLNCVNSANSSATESHGNPTPVRSPDTQDSLTNIHKGINDFLVAVPEPLRDTISKISVDLASRAVSMSPVVGEVLESFSKLGKVASPQECSSAAPVAPNSSRDGGLRPNFTLPGPALSRKVPTSCAFQKHLKLDPLSGAKAPSHGDGKDDYRENQNKKKPAGPDGQAGSDAQKTAAHASSPSDLGTGSFGCPFSGTSVHDDSNSNQFHISMRPIPVCYPKEHQIRDNWTKMGMVHKGIRCDGCGVLPIPGPRFKSTVKEDYDLCSSCFLKMGNNNDYIKMEKPLTFRPAHRFRGFPASAQNPWINTAVPPCSQGGLNFRLARPKLDSRFVVDVNISDGTVMAPSTPFTKIWRMRNNGSLVWPRGTQLIWVGGDAFSDSLSVDLEIPEEGLPIEGELDVAVDFVAPEAPGRYISYWRMASSSGAKFGQRVWVLIHVDAYLKDSALNRFQGLDLNASPRADSSKGSVLVYMNNDPVHLPASVRVLGTVESDTGMNPKVAQSSGPVDNGILDGEVTPAIAPTATQAPSSSSIAYPIIYPYPITSPEVEVSNAPVDSSLLAGEVTPAIPPSASQAPSSLSTAYPITDQKVEVSNAPLDNSLLVGEVAPVIPPSASQGPSSASASYPIIDLAEMPEVETRYGASSIAKGTSVTPEGDKETKEMEHALLKELEEMGFKQIDLNKEILRENDYNLEQSVDALCGANDWDPILEELQEMGFCDDEKNKRLLKKNNGSIKRVVMDLLTGDKA